MTKGKNQRKRERAEQRAQQKLAAAQLPLTEGVESEHKRDTADPSNYDGDKKKEGSMGTREVSKPRSTFSERAITAFTLALVVLGYFQWRTTDSQLNVMQNDERAWLELKQTPDAVGSDTRTFQIQTGQPVTYPLWIRNSGKTPAKNISIQAFVDIIDALQAPPLDHVETSANYPHNEIVVGIDFPNSDFKQTIVRTALNHLPVTATDTEIKAIAQNQAYLVAYGMVSYDDVFNVHHWTKFCDWISKDGSFQTKECTQYNSVDKN